MIVSHNADMALIEININGVTHGCFFDDNEDALKFKEWAEDEKNQKHIESLLDEYQ